MDGIYKNRAHNIDRQIPGCLGRMVNLFDLSAGVSGNRLLADKPHHDGCLSWDTSDAARMSSPSSANKIQNKMATPDLRNLPYSKSHSTPMKMLLAQEMSNEVELKHDPPNVVAKLMGLDSLPQQQPGGYSMERSQSKGYSRHTLSQSREPVQHWQREHIYLDKRMKSKAYQYEEHNAIRDVYEVRKESQKLSSMREKSQKRTCHENEAKKKMDLVRQKFMEAKRLATSEKFCQSKEFQDAVEVLSSNKEFFLEFLQEPNALLSKSPRELQSIFVPPETKRITVLRPSKMTDHEKFPQPVKKNENPVKVPPQVAHESCWEKNSPCLSPAYLSYDGDVYGSQPTRIVVLKPNAGKLQEIKSSVSLPSTPPRTPHADNFLDAKDNEVYRSRQMVKEGVRYRHKSVLGDRRYENSSSSVFSNGYGGDTSSFNHSEDRYAVENFSDSEVVSPTSRYSWDCVNRFGSPFSSSSLSRASYSPESSVCREAKKRLSERWAMMASSGNSREERRSGRSSNTLGEMLALSDANKLVRNEEDCNDRELRMPASSCMTNLAKDLVDMPKDLQRSKSLPSSSRDYGERINFDLSGLEGYGAQVLMESTKKNAASSLKGKVSSLFFSRNKRPSKEKSSSFQPTEESRSETSDIPKSALYSPCRVASHAYEFAEYNHIEECSPPGRCGLQSRISDSATMGQTLGAVPQKGEMSISKPAMLGNSIENQDQPSPISVLELLYDEEGSATPESSGKQLPTHSLVSNLVGKSPPIGSVARSLTWDDTCCGRDYPNPLDHTDCLNIEQDEQDWLSSTREILHAVGLNGEENLGIFTLKWHSPESPLDPSLREKYSNLDEEGISEAKRRQRRSNRKFIFDCVNAALVEITGHYGFDSDGAHGLVSEHGSIADRVWCLVKEWLAGEVRCMYSDEWDSSSLVVESVVRREMMGGVWSQQLRLEVLHLGEQVERKLLLELVDEIVGDLTCNFTIQS